MLLGYPNWLQPLHPARHLLRSLATHNDKISLGRPLVQQCLSALADFLTRLHSYYGS